MTVLGVVQVMSDASNPNRPQSEAKTARRSHNQGLGRFSYALEDLEITDRVQAPSVKQTGTQLVLRLCLPRPMFGN